jgi:hypothetical protein
MGQYIPVDPSTQLTKQAADLSTSPSLLSKDLKCVPCFKVPCYSIVYLK